MRVGNHFTVLSNMSCPQKIATIYRNACNDIWTQVESDIVENSNMGNFLASDSSSSSGNRCDYIHDSINKYICEPIN